ncbi:MAG: prephenate dehydratase [Lachnospiraceae bacterium]|nr:prephenate dehydratase [Lachnospiraceae bacterium]MCI7595596.1 prephenate dehydratase [Lachnospiraceae bacterium]MDD7049468.1 prephenate dehydratase [Lachnospiraceae bacterium]MDY3222059.1 prephenate dehydratase [Lachnospiraceae bacterium]MDY4096825.1 prephenate dehydratase [Lachnospiraceae bacterium]
MKELSELRGELDSIDRRLVELYQQRLEVCKSVAEYKIATGKMVLDRDREAEKIHSLTALAADEFNEKAIQELFEQIMSVSRKLQYRMLADTDKGRSLRLPFDAVETLGGQGMRVVFQGAPGSYSQEALEAFFGRETDSFAVDTFRQAMCALEEGSADYGILPIENSTAGIVSEIYDLLVEFEHYIVGEQVLQIEHCLLGLPGAGKEDIETVFSHPQSLMQSDLFLRKQPGWKQVSLLNNAFAARKVKEDGLKSQAAIASRRAGEIYGLEILEQGVNQTENNCTRFIVVTNRKIFLDNASKISLCFEIPHESGSLYHILSHFIYNNLNLTKIESRPIRERSFEYRFFIDFDGNLKDSGVKNALRGLREETTNMKILGNY